MQEVLPGRVEVENLELCDRDVLGQGGCEVRDRCRGVHRNDGAALVRAAGQKHGREQDQSQGGCRADSNGGGLELYNVPSMAEEGVGVAGAAPICGAEIGLILRSAILAEVHNAEAGVDGLREGGTRRSA